MRLTFQPCTADPAFYADFIAPQMLRRLSVTPRFQSKSSQAA